MGAARRSARWLFQGEPAGTRADPVFSGPSAAVRDVPRLFQNVSLGFIEMKMEPCETHIPFMASPRVRVSRCLFMVFGPFAVLACDLL